MPITYRDHFTEASSYGRRYLGHMHACTCTVNVLPILHTFTHTLAAHPGSGRAVLPAKEGQKESTVTERGRPLPKEGGGGERRRE